MLEYLEYKGYVGEVVRDDEADTLHARVINSGTYPIAIAQASDALDLEREFRCSIDVYLEGCRELRIKPLRPQLLDAITDDIWAEAAPGFGDPELASE